MDHSENLRGQADLHEPRHSFQLPPRACVQAGDHAPPLLGHLPEQVLHGFRAPHAPPREVEAGGRELLLEARKGSAVELRGRNREHVGDLHHCHRLAPTAAAGRRRAGLTAVGADGAAVAGVRFGAPPGARGAHVPLDVDQLGRGGVQVLHLEADRCQGSLQTMRVVADILRRRGAHRAEDALIVLQQHAPRRALAALRNHIRRLRPHKVADLLLVVIA
mmetsp:Transcript_57597/g.166737  ORF Transcript_57597/g.166737 Transcript_57597/m.166737 type:complete len:219 (+) Transcript_57597:2476-3132(+)